MIGGPHLRRARVVGATLLLAVASAARAQVPPDYLKSLESAAQAADPRFAGFSVQRGQAWFSSRQGTDWSCSTCHTSNPMAEGRHATTGRAIAALAPAANAERLTDAKTIEKWFRRNCGDVLGRVCTAVEKGDVIAYLTSLKR